MILKDLIAYLEAKDPNIVLPRGFFHPHSYRGYYEDVAFAPKDNVRVGDMLRDARAALGATFEGYKGGSYTMHEYSDCWLAKYGRTGAAISVVVLDAMFNRAAFDALVAACEQAQHKIEQALSGQYPDGAALQSALTAIRAALALSGVRDA